MMNKDKDQDWLDALAGKPNPNADPEVTRRAVLLRQTIQRHDASFGISKHDSEARFQKLKIRMRSDGLLDKEEHVLLKDLLLQLVAAVSAMLTSINIMLRTAFIPIGLATQRGDERQIVLAADPEERLKQLATELDRLSIKYQIERKAGKILLKMHGVDPVKDDVASFLERNHITPPVRDSLELDIRPMAKS